MVTQAPPWPSATLVTAATDAVARARRLATELGPESSRTWNLLELAANVETTARALEGALNELPASEVLAG
jgi:hypothetical protein